MPRPAHELTAICEAYWSAGAVGYAEYAAAMNELASCGLEVRDWARRMLRHPNYDAREAGAFLLGALGRRRLLGGTTPLVVDELGALIRRPETDDAGEVQAIDAALLALGNIGDPLGIPFLASVLYSSDRRLAGDTRWSAVEALAQLTGEPFLDAPDAVEAAKAWLAAHG